MFFCPILLQYDGVFPSSIIGRFYFMHSLRRQNLPRSIKKNHQLFLKTKKVRAKFGKFFEKNEIFDFLKSFTSFSKILIFSKIFIENPNENFRSQNFSNKSWNFSKNSKISFLLEKFSKLCSNFFNFQYFSRFFLWI